MLVFIVLVSCVAMKATASFPEKENTVKKEAGEVWEFYSSVKQPSAEELANESSYKFGQDAGFLYAQFLNYSVVKEAVVPGDPTMRTVIRKPVIYKAVRSIEKQLEKNVKNQVCTKEQATAEFIHILKIAISAVDSENQSFEDALQANRKNINKLLSIFKDAKLIEIQYSNSN